VKDTIPNSHVRNHYVFAHYNALNQDSDLNIIPVKVKVTLRLTYESASPSWRQAPIWDPRPILLSP
jgi:hypothetical protein